VYLDEDGLIYKIYDKKNKASVMLFMNEVMILGRIRHKQMPELVRFDRKNLYLVMTRCKGRGLDYILYHVNLTNEEKRCIAVQVVEFMIYLHSKGILYLDLKPENLMVDLETMETSLIDFNISLLIGHKQKFLRGTLGYISPEVLNGHDFSYPADVYSFGVLLYVIYSQKPVENFGWFCFFMPDDIRKIITMCTREDPGSRPVFSDILEMMRGAEHGSCRCSIQ